MKIASEGAWGGELYLAMCSISCFRPSRDNFQAFQDSNGVQQFVTRGGEVLRSLFHSLVATRSGRTTKGLLTYSKCLQTIVRK